MTNAEARELVDILVQSVRDLEHHRSDRYYREMYENDRDKVVSALSSTDSPSAEVKQP